MSIYLDCNATTPIEPEVVEKINNYLTKDFGNEGSHTHEYGSVAKKAVQEARDNIGNLIDASRNEIIFTSGATESNNIAILGLKDFGEKNNKKHIITTSIEHKAVLEPIEELKKIGFDVDFLKVDQSGRINPNDIKDKLRKDTLLISVMSVNNETGLIQPIKEICDSIKDHDCFFHVDAAQSFGKDLETNFSASETEDAPYDINPFLFIAVNNLLRKTSSSSKISNELSIVWASLKPNSIINFLNQVIS